MIAAPRVRERELVPRTAIFHGGGPPAVAEAASSEPRHCGCRDGSHHRYCAIFTFSLAAACVTWPAIAVARLLRRAAERVCLGRSEASAAPLLLSQLG